MKRSVLILLIGLCHGHIQGQSQNNYLINDSGDQNHPLLGTWVIDGIHYIYADTTYQTQMNYKGRLMVDTHNYAIIYNPFGTARNRPESLRNMTDEEKLYSFKTIVFNSGTYQRTATDFITTSDAAKVAGFEGGIQYYEMDTVDNQLTLTMYDETYPDGGKPEWYGKLKIRFILSKDR